MESLIINSMSQIASILVPFVSKNQLSEHAGFASPLPFLQRQRELPAGDKLR